MVEYGNSGKYPYGQDSIAQGLLVHSDRSGTGIMATAGGLVAAKFVPTVPFQQVDLDKKGVGILNLIILASELS